ncbi:hypothetical protein GALMADRAFT_148485 [Galerina marginata CBS 339.88]|uniref:Ribonuclease H1 N-terminal domain-containing protein n=1 Tax=Galerina marginata (strain CBS 339.88) TaxID=685588 RepID=A0A067S6Z0_GALM3|nr:hypothetical protein GALMADRAFT_148485 [Galerina marginata CBS 339.88]
MLQAIHYVSALEAETPLIAPKAPTGNTLGSGLSRLWRSQVPTSSHQQSDVKPTPTGFSEKTPNLEGSTPQIERNDSQEDSEPADEAKFYAVLVGRQPGVFHGSDTLKANTEGIPGAQICKFDTEQEAISTFRAALMARKVERVTLFKAERILDDSDIPTIPGVQAGSTVNLGKHWAVLVGRTPGVFNQPADVSGSLTGIPGAHCQKCSSYAEALFVFRNALSAKQVKLVVYNIEREILTPAHFL